MLKKERDQEYIKALEGLIYINFILKKWKGLKV